MIIYVSTNSHSFTHRPIARDVKFFRQMTYFSLFARRKLPQATYIFTDFCRLNACQLELAANTYARLKEAGMRVLNDPARVAHRLTLLRRLRAADINSFNAWPAEDSAEVDRFPVFVRTQAAHRGNLTDLIHTPAELEQTLEALITKGYPRRDLMLSQYCAEPFEGDIYRKMSVYRIGGRYVTAPTVHERSWTAKVGEPGVASQDAYDRDLVRIRDNEYAEAAAAAFKIAEIDYGRADFSIVDGRPEFYEINTNPTMSAPIPHPVPARVEAMKESHRQYVDALRAIDTSPSGGSTPLRFTAELLHHTRKLRLVPGYQWIP